MKKTLAIVVLLCTSLLIQPCTFLRIRFCKALRIKLRFLFCLCPHFSLSLLTRRQEVARQGQKLKTWFFFLSLLSLFTVFEFMKILLVTE